MTAKKTEEKSNGNSIRFNGEWGKCLRNSILSKACGRQGMLSTVLTKMNNELDK